ncbi:MAG: SGNH/GDSL hydrolase family protein [Nitrospinota bacterium]
MMFKIVLYLSILLFIISSCNMNTAKDRNAVHFTRTLDILQSKGTLTIVTFGDSVTAGFGVGKNFSDYLKERLNHMFPESNIRMINSGVYGESAGKGLLRIEKDVLRYNPDLVTINFGLNEIKLGISKKEFTGNIQSMIERIRKDTDSEIMLLTTNMTANDILSAHLIPINSALRDISRKMKVGCADVYAAWEDKVKSGVPPRSLLVDSVHPDETGHRLIAETIIDRLGLTPKF